MVQAASSANSQLVVLGMQVFQSLELVPTHLIEAEVKK
jgi:hypothetical protein